MEESTIVVTAQQKELFESLASSEGMSVGDYLQKAVKSVEFVLREWGMAGQPEEVVEEPAPVLSKDPRFTIGDKVYTDATYKGLMLKVLQDVGYRKVFEAYPEDKTPVIFHRRPEGVADTRGVEVKEGRYSFWVNTNHSSKNIFTVLQRVAEIAQQELT